MARYKEDDEDDDKPVERKRRRPKKKPATDEDDGPPSKRGGNAIEDDDDDEGENSLSTGNVLLDIVLDFFDDCIDWAKTHVKQAIIIAVLAFLLFVGACVFIIWSIISYINRPTWQDALVAYEAGAYLEARQAAQTVLKYAPKTDTVAQSTALFVQGISTSLMAENTWDTDRRPYYLAAANYLRESEAYGFPSKHRAEGYFQLGKNPVFLRVVVQLGIGLEIGDDGADDLVVRPL